jgi:hypothetical protein
MRAMADPLHTGAKHWAWLPVENNKKTIMETMSFFIFELRDLGDPHSNKHPDLYAINVKYLFL